MARHRRIDCLIWNDETFRKLSDDAKLIVFFLTSHPNLTSLGAMRATMAGLAGELRWRGERLPKAFATADESFIQFDAEACFIALPRFLDDNPPQSPNVVKSWAAELEFLPNCPLKDDLIQRAKSFVKTLTPAFQRVLPKTFKTSQELEAEKDRKAERQTRIDTSPVVLVFPVCGDVPTWELRQARVDRLRELFPHLDVEKEMRAAVAWCEANPSRCKTAIGMPRFVNSWLDRAQNDGHGSNGKPAQKTIPLFNSKGVGL